MAGERPSVFDEDLDLSQFGPKTSHDVAAVPPETVRRISEEGGFPSRAPATSAAKAVAARSSVPRSGRTVLLNARVTQRAHDRFHTIIEAERIRYESGDIMHRVTLGELVERALAALEREMSQESKGG